MRSPDWSTKESAYFAGEKASTALMMQWTVHVGLGVAALACVFVGIRIAASYVKVCLSL